MNINDSKKLIRNSGIWNWGDIKHVLEHINSKGCDWSKEDITSIRLFAAGHIDELIRMAFGPLLEIYSKRHNSRFFTSLPANSHWSVLRNLALPKEEFMEERKTLLWEDEEMPGIDVVYSEIVSEIRGVTVEQRMENLLDSAQYYIHTLRCRHLIYLTDRTLLHSLIQSARQDEDPDGLSDKTVLREIVVSQVTEEIGLVLSDAGQSTENVTIITGEHSKGRLKSVHDIKVTTEEATRWL